LFRLTPHKVRGGVVQHFLYGSFSRFLSGTSGAAPDEQLNLHKIQDGTVRALLRECSLRELEGNHAEDKY
jgi:hypothetical protein